MSLSCWKCGASLPIPMADLRRLQEETDRAIRAAFHDGVEDSVDWENARCAEVRLVLGGRGAFYQVIVRGAHPDAAWLREHIRARLALAGYEAEVITEW